MNTTTNSVGSVGTVLNIGGSDYSVVETATKRRQDVRRWEVTAPGRVTGDGSMSKPYVVTFQSTDGSMTACSCKGGIFHKKCKHMTALREFFGQTAAPMVAVKAVPAAPVSHVRVVEAAAPAPVAVEEELSMEDVLLGAAEELGLEKAIATLQAVQAKRDRARKVARSVKARAV